MEYNGLGREGTGREGEREMKNNKRFGRGNKDRKTLGGGGRGENEELKGLSNDFEKL